jgi:hypothetical protein
MDHMTQHPTLKTHRPPLRTSALLRPTPTLSRRQPLHTPGLPRAAPAVHDAVVQPRGPALPELHVQRPDQEPPPVGGARHRHRLVPVLLLHLLVPAAAGTPHKHTCQHKQLAEASRVHGRGMQHQLGSLRFPEATTQDEVAGGSCGGSSRYHGQPQNSPLLWALANTCWTMAACVAHAQVPLKHLLTADFQHPKAAGTVTWTPTTATGKMRMPHLKGGTEWLMCMERHAGVAVCRNLLGRRVGGGYHSSSFL